MEYKIVTAGEPSITLEEALAHLRALGYDEIENTAVIEPIIAAAQEYCENVTGIALAEQTLLAYPDKLEAVIRLPRPALRSVIHVKCYDKDGEEHELTDFDVDTVHNNLIINSIPTFSPRVYNPIEVKYVSGIDSVPKTIRQAMLLLIGHWYENRSAVEVGIYTSRQIDFGVRTLCNQHKVWWY